MPPPLAGIVGLSALVEQERVVLDVAVVAEADVPEAAAVAAAQVAAHPVVVELVVVGAGADADAAGARRRGREQLVAGGGVQRDVVVVHVDVQVLAVRQLHTSVRGALSVCARTRSRIGGAARDVGRREFALADVDAARSVPALL